MNYYKKYLEKSITMLNRTFQVIKHTDFKEIELEKFARQYISIIGVIKQDAYIFKEK